MKPPGSIDLDRLADLNAEARRLIALSRKTRQDVREQRATRAETDETPPVIAYTKRKADRAP